MGHYRAKRRSEIVITLGRWRIASLRKPILAWVLLLIGLLGAFQALYYSGLYFRGVASVCVAGLFVWLALSTKIKQSGFPIVFIPPVFLLCAIFLYAYVFSSNTGAPILPSVLGQRGYVFFLLGPIVYLLHMRGWRLADFEGVFVTAASITILSYLAAYIWAAGPQGLQSWFTLGQISNDSLVSGLRISHLLALFGVFYFGSKLFQHMRITGKIVFGLMFLASLARLVNEVPRGLIVAAAVAVLIYVLLLSGPARIKFSTVVAPVLVAVALYYIPYALGFLQKLLSRVRDYPIREDTAAKAWDAFQEHLWLGYGVASNQSVSFQAIFGETFYPGDVGLLGVAFKFGIVGVALYVFLSLWLVFNLLRLVRLERRRGRANAFLWTLLIVSLTILIASPLQAKFISPGGMPMAALAWGIIMSGKYGLHGLQTYGVSFSKSKSGARNSAIARRANAQYPRGDAG